MEQKRYDKGIRGEVEARAFLEAKGMAFVRSRYRAAGGEIDLVMREGGTLVFVEVKYRPAGHLGDGLRSVTQDKRRRLWRAATAYLASCGRMDIPARVDVVEITADGITHIPNAFIADGSRELR